MKFIGLICLLLLITTCDKIELPIQMKVTPIFEMKGTVGNKPLSLAAGLNDVELITSYENAPLQVIALQGELRNKNCAGACNGSFRLILRQNALEFNANPTKNISLGRKLFYTPPKDSLAVKAISTSTLASTNSTKYSYLWTVNDTKVSDRESFSYEMQPWVTAKVCLSITHPDQSVANQCQIVDFNVLDSFPGLKVTLDPVFTANKIWILQARVKGIGPFKFIWDNVSNEKNFIELDTKKNTSHCITVKDNRGNVASACIDMNPEGKIKTKVDFDLLYEIPKLREWAQYNSVEMTYVDDQGLEWSTTRQSQIASSVFEVLSSEPYELNNLKQATRKIKISFDAFFYNKNKAPLQIKATGHMAVAVPQ